MASSLATPDDVYARIYRAVRAVPPGRVATYGQIALLAGLPGHARQVGYALSMLPDGSGVPWQRILNSRGEVSPRAGEDVLGPSQGFHRHLLIEEGVVFDASGRVDLRRFGWEAGARPSRRPRFSARRERDALLAALTALGSPARARQEQAYLKSTLDFRGVAVPAIRRLARSWLREHRDVGRADLVGLARACWRSRTHELRSVAVEILAARVESLERRDLALLEWMLRRAGTWAHVDAIAPTLVGDLLAREVGVLRTLERWRRDDDFWIRRAALLALLPSLKREATHWRRFVRWADALLGEPEFFLRKAIGWVLREVSKRDPVAVAAYVRARATRLSGVTFREAVRRLPARERRTLERLRATH